MSMTWKWSLFLNKSLMFWINTTCLLFFTPWKNVYCSSVEFPFCQIKDSQVNNNRTRDTWILFKSTKVHTCHGINRNSQIRVELGTSTFFLYLMFIVSLTESTIFIYARSEAMLHALRRKTENTTRWGKHAKHRVCAMCNKQ